MVHGAPNRKKSQSGVSSTNIENYNEVDSAQPQPTPPDGGWGWMVVFGSFMIHIISKYSFQFSNFYKTKKRHLSH